MAKWRSNVNATIMKTDAAMKICKEVELSIECPYIIFLTNREHSNIEPTYVGEYVQVLPHDGQNG